MLPSLALHAEVLPGFDRVLTPEALAFVAELDARFGPRREALLAERKGVQARFDAGELPDFLPDTAEIREGDWKVAPIPADLADRRVEITGPVDRKMVINALNSGANTYMADFEDSTSPTWRNLVEGQVNLMDAVRRDISFQSEAGKSYALGESLATLMVRPRGWHLPENHARRAGRPISGSLFDFGLFFFHNAAELVARGSGPYFYLPKLQHWREAELWNDVFAWAESTVGVPAGAVRATVLIETLPAAFQMHEILHALKDRSAGLNCGRWDYIFSTIKTLRAHADRVMPDRRDITMTQPAMAAYTRLLVQTCHRRGIHAMGGMAAQIPIKNDPAANDAALARVVADKRREATDGHDGTWVAHPALVPLAKAEFDSVLKAANQIDRPLDGASYTAAHLLALPTGHRTEDGLRECLRVGVQYLEAWLRGLGCVPLYNLMEDAATAEISRAQLWQWVRYGAQLDDGRVVDEALLRQVLADEMGRLRKSLGENRWAAGQFIRAVKLYTDWTLAEDLGDFLTVGAYPYIVEAESLGW